jgi:DNA transformation protein and related proteins
MANDLSQQINIGKVVAARLEEVGISTLEELKAVGSKQAFLRLQTVDSGACLHELMALEGAIRGIRKYSLPEEVKADLKQFQQLSQKNLAE